MMLQYNELAASLDRIRRFLQSSPEEQQTADQRRFAYIACISALYSSFESFAERIAFRFGELLLMDSNNFSDEQIRNLRRRYIHNASALLGQSLGVGRYREVTHLDVAKSRASCLDDSASIIDLRLELIALHSSNLRWESLSELFYWAVPDIQSRVQHSDAVEVWASRTDNASEAVPMDVLKGELDDLVERRNEVAHRAIPDEILSYERLLSKISYLEAVALGLIASLAIVLIEASINKGECVALGAPSKYFRARRVVIIEALQSSISEGDSILAFGANYKRWGKVLEIQIDGRRTESADPGLKLAFFLISLLQEKPNCTYGGLLIRIWLFLPMPSSAIGGLRSSARPGTVSVPVSFRPDTSVSADIH